MRLVWMAFGLVSLALGAAGAVLPLLPTTPFVLLAAFCFARSSPQFHSWLINHPTFGPAIMDWRHERAISKRGKVAGSIAMGLAFAVSLLLRVPWTVIIVQAIVFVPVLLFIWSRPTATRGNRD